MNSPQNGSTLPDPASNPPPGSEFYFEGFNTPNVTLVPDDFFDVLAPNLTEAELRVCLYIIRRTFGFKKTGDAISFTQMTNGIRSKGGAVIDQGTGMSRKGVWAGINGLLRKGVIEVDKRISSQGDNDTNVYSLRFRNGVVSQGNYGGFPKKPGVVSQGNHGSFPEKPGVVSRGNPHHDKSQKTDLQKHRHHRRDADPEQSIASPADDDAFLKKTKTGDDAAEKTPMIAEATLPLVGKLTETGINKRLALRLVSEYPAERIEQALAYLPFRSARNPAAYLVREIQEGNWVPPAGLIVQQQRKESTDRWKDAASKLQVEREEAEKVRGERIESILQTLSPEVQEQLQKEASGRVARLTGKRLEDVDPQSPWVIGTLHNLIQETYAERLNQPATQSA